MWRWSLLVALGALVVAACVDVRLVTVGTGGSGGEALGGSGGTVGEPTSSSSSTASSGGAGGVDCCGDVDVAVVIDNSPSLDDDDFIRIQGLFFNLFQPILDFADRACTFHIGFFTAHPKINQPDEECRFLGSLSYTGADGARCLPDDRRFITKDDELTQLIGCLAQTGRSNSLDGAPVEALVNALTIDSYSNADGCNFGFFRDDAVLVSLFVADQDDDESDINGTAPGGDQPAEWEDAIVGARDGDVVALGILPSATSECGDAPGPNWPDFLSQFPANRTASASICSTDASDVAATLSDIADEICGAAAAP